MTEDRQDFVTTFVASAESVNIPELFREWGALFCLSAAMGRSVWVPNVKKRSFPNLYIMMVSPPGIGKSDLNDCVLDVLHGAQVPIAANNMTIQAMRDSMEDSTVTPAINNSPKGVSATQFVLDEQYHQLNIVSSEFKETFPQHDVATFQILADWWDCKRRTSEVKRKYNEREIGDDGKSRIKLGRIDIEKPCVTMLTGIQPAVFNSTFPAEAWDAGFLSRTIFVYDSGSEEQPLDLFGQEYEELKHLDWMVNHIRNISSWWGGFTVGEDYKKNHWEWVKAGKKPVPTNFRLTNYLKRREHQVVKLAICYAASVGRRRLIDIDFQRALNLLIKTEEAMKHFFEVMIRSDEEVVVKELVHWLRYSMQGTPVQYGDIQRQLIKLNLPSARHRSFMEAVIEAKFIKRVEKDNHLFYTCTDDPTEAMDSGVSDELKQHSLTPKGNKQ